MPSLFSNFSSNVSFIINCIGEIYLSFLFSSFFFVYYEYYLYILKIKAKLSPIWHEGEHTWNCTRINIVFITIDWTSPQVLEQQHKENYYIITWVGGLIWGQQSSNRTAAIIVQCAWWEQSSLHKRVKSPFTFGLGIEVPPRSLTLSLPLMVSSRRCTTIYTSRAFVVVQHWKSPRSIESYSHHMTSAPLGD